MGVTKFDKLDGQVGRILYTNSLPVAPSGYYGGDVDSTEWQGGEIAYNYGDNRLYIQTATSGTTPTWKRLLESFATSTTSSSTSTSTSTSSSSTSSSTSSSSTTTS